MTDTQPSSLDKLKAKRDQVNARIQQMEAAEKQRQRKQDLQRKILVGTYYLEKMQKEDRMSELVELMDSVLTRNSDRKCFDLPLLEKVPVSEDATPVTE